ncbi:MAG: rubredoxin [Clostridia bacterium]|nr:hypothetical protein [Eubacteriales bacterium]NCC48659.1 rubredoxin [Clostridia bacterium]
MRQPDTMSWPELSAICSNLARTSEKQWLTEESRQFRRLADWFSGHTEPVQEASLADLASAIQADLADPSAQAKAAAAKEPDRGALRALTWGGKTTSIQKSVLARYEKQQDGLIEQTQLWVCDICGFIFIGDTPPDICPICKVPNSKLLKITGEA